MIAAENGARIRWPSCCGRWQYQVYGLRLGSNLELPGLEPAAEEIGGAEIAVTLGILPEPLDRLVAHSQPYYIEHDGGAESQPHLVINRWDDGTYLFAYDSGVRFVVNATANAIWGSWEDGGPEDAALYLLGPILGFLLRLRGVTCLHAGAVVADGRALALVGPSGAGKSTLTTVLARRRLSVLTDDVLPIVRDAQGLRAVAGYPRLRLRPEVVEHLYGDAAAKPRLTPNWERRYLDLAAEGLVFHAGEVPLGAIYVLERDEGACVPLIEPVTGHESVSLLAANTYRNELLTRALRQDEFLFLAELVRRIPIRRVRMASGLDAVEGVGRRILDDCRTQLRVQHQ